MIEHNAVGTRVAARPLWQVFVLSLVTGGLYRVWLAWRMNADLAAFARASPGRLDGAHAIHANPAANAFAVAVLLAGTGTFLYGALFAVASAPPEYGVEPSTADSLVAMGVGLAGVGFGIASLVRTAGRIRAARRLAGLAPSTPATGGALVPILAGELLGIPATTFALQHSLNDLWSRYPPLLDEDLHGEMAPPDRRAVAIAERPRLHEERLLHIADELEQPRLVPWVTIAFAVGCVLVFVWQLSEHGPFPAAEDLERIGGLRRGLEGQEWRFWTANVLHGSIDHLTGNMVGWVLVGSIVERVVGHLRMIALVIAGAAGCSAGALYSNPDVVGIGASGVVFASFGLAAMVDPLARRAVGKLGWSLVTLGIGLSTFAPGISSGGHVGGVLAGFALGGVIMVVWRVRRESRIDPAALRAAPVDRSAPLAPDRELSIAERIAHLDRRRLEGALQPHEYDRLRRALVTRG